MTKTKEEAAYLALSKRLRDAGWAVERLVSPDGLGNFVAELGERRLVGNIKVSPDSRRFMFEALIASSILRARVAAGRGGATPLAVLAAPTVTDRMFNALAEFVRTYAPDVAIATLSNDGTVRMFSPEFAETYEGELGHRSRQLGASHPVNLFSDLNRWMIKVLLASALPPDMLAAPRPRIRTPRDLAAAADVSAVAARRLLAALRAAGFLEAGKSGLGLVRVSDLLQMWRADTRRSSQELRARWLLPRGPAQLHETLARRSAAGEKLCLGLFAAAEALGMRHVHGVPAHVYATELSESLLDRMELVAATHSENADVIVRLARWPESVFRACAHRTTRTGAAVPSADVLQCWLDLVDHPVRGEEQAQLIWSRMLAPSLGLQQN